MQTINWTAIRRHVKRIALATERTQSEVALALCRAHEKLGFRINFPELAGSNGKLDFTEKTSKRQPLEQPLKLF